MAAAVEAAPQAAVAPLPMAVEGSDPAPVVQLKLGDLPRTISSASKPPPSPFESTVQPGAPPAAPAAAAGDAQAAQAAGGGGEAAAAPTNGGQERAPRRLRPTKSAMKMRPADDEGGAAAGDPKGLSWADTHGQAIHHVQEYQPSDHGSESFVKRSLGCSCSIQ